MRKIRKGDNVVVIAGRDKGKRGEVTRVTETQVVVGGLNQVKKHQRPNPMKNEPGGIVNKDMPLHVSNVAVWNPSRRNPTASASVCSRTAARCASTSRTAS